MSSAPCEDKLELLGAWLDGEASPVEVAELERHLASCPGCRQASALLADLGSSVAHQPTLAPPADFAERTARAVTPSPAPTWRGWLRWSALGQSSAVQALAHLLDRGRQGRPGPARVVLVFGVPALLLGLISPQLPVWFLKIAAVGLLVGLPLHHWQGRVARLGSLQRGRALEEILLTGLSRAQLLDALALSGLASLAWAALGFAPLLALADPRAGLLWLPALLALAWLGSYPAACVSLGGGWRVGALASLGGLGLVLWAEDILALGTDSESLAYASGATLPWGPGLVAGACCFIARGLALRLLEHKPAPTRAGRNRWLLGVSESPVVMRENVRVAARAPRGLVGVALVHLPSLLVSVVLAWMLNSNVHSAVTWSVILILTAGVLLRTALRTLGAVLHERERGTWESLLQTGAVTRHYVSGWVRVAVGEAWLAFLSLLGLPLLVAAGLLQPSTQILASAGAAAAGLPGVAALLGLALSARSRTLGEARTSLLAWSGGAVVVTLGLQVVIPVVLVLGSPVTPLLMATLFVAGFTALWSADALRRNLFLVGPQAVPATLTGRLAIASACAGAALGVASGCWPTWPVDWDMVPFQLAVGYGLGWAAGRSLALLVAPLLRFSGRIALSRWLITVAWATAFGTAVASLRLLMVCLDWWPAHWAYDQMALAVAVSAGVAAVLGLRPAEPEAAVDPLWALAVSGVRVAATLALLAAGLGWEYHLPPVDAEPVLAQVRERQDAARRLPPPNSRLEKLLRGDWPAGASADYVSPGTLRNRVAEVAELIARGDFPARDPLAPLAMRPALLQAIASVLADLEEAPYSGRRSFEGLLLSLEWGARGHHLQYADRALNILTQLLESGTLSDIQIRRLLARTAGLDGADFTRPSDDWFAARLDTLDAQRLVRPDRPEFYWRHQRALLTLAYLRVRPLCAELAAPDAIRQRQIETLQTGGPHEPAEAVMSESPALATLVSQERQARESLRALRATAKAQLERRK